MCRTLEGHAHWVNTLALSTDYVLRTEAIVKTSDKVLASDSKCNLLINSKHTIFYFILKKSFFVHPYHFNVSLKNNDAKCS